MSYYDQAKDNPKERYCISCGRKGVQWPKTDPTGVTNYKATPLACSWRCLASRVIGEYMGGGDGYRLRLPDYGINVAVECPRCLEYPGVEPIAEREER